MACLRKYCQRPLASLLLVMILLTGLLSAGCAEEPVIGEIDDQATVALIRFEDQGDGISGVVYREINRFSSFLADSDVPVLAVFYSSLAPVNSQIIPRLEQMADDYQGALQIAWIDADAEPALADSFSVEALPQFTVVIGGAMKRSLVGYEQDGASKLQALVDAYLVAP